MKKASEKKFKNSLYYQLLYLRRAEERIAADYVSSGMRSPLHLYIGHEAVAVGICSELKKEDLVFPYYRSHGWYLAKGGNLNKLVAELHGKEDGCSKGLGGSMHLIDLEAGIMGSSAIVAGTIAHAVGAALALRFQNKDAVCVASFGDGAAEEGAFYEALNFAALKKLPVIFVCENNLYAANTPMDQRRAQPEIFRHGPSAGMEGVRVDGNDVLAVCKEAERAVARARSGQGPTLMECMTYRLVEHCGVNEDYHLGYRAPEEGKEWKRRDPLAKASGFVAPEESRQMDAEIAAQLDAALAFAEASPFPSKLIEEVFQ